jgi:fructose 1,6-bisphosphate aldolase/phosphatase
MCYLAFEQAVETSRRLGLYGPGQDLPIAGKKLFERTGNVQGAGPSVAELNLDPKHAQSQVMFVWSDKTDPGSYSIPLWKIFNNINMQDSEMLAASNARFGYWFLVQDVELKDAASELGVTTEELDKKGSGLTMLHSGVDNRLLTTILSDRDRYSVKAIFGTDEQGNPTRTVVAVSTDKLHNISGKYEGKDDPVMLMLGQKDYPAPGEIMRAGWSEPFLAAGNCRGSHYAVLMASRVFADTAYSSNPVVTSVTASVDYETGYIGGMVDNFFGPAWDRIRAQATEHDLWFHRAHGPFQPKTLPKGALEYQIGYMEALGKVNGVRRYFDLRTVSVQEAANKLVGLTVAMRSGKAPAAEETGNAVD